MENSIERNSGQDVGEQFNSLEFSEFISFLRERLKQDPSLRFSIEADWHSLEKTRSAKALFDQYGSRLHIDSITIRATREQHEEDPNAFASGVRWVELKNKTD